MKPQARRIGALAGCLMATAGASAFAAELAVTVHNIEQNKGTVHFVIYDRANWMSADPEKFAGAKSVDLAGHEDEGPLTATIDLEPGKYAAFVYHDLNANFEFDKNFVGIPKEPYAFSQDFDKRKRPGFDECSFVVGADGASIAVTLKS